MKKAARAALALTRLLRTIECFRGFALHPLVIATGCVWCTSSRAAHVPIIGMTFLNTQEIWRLHLFFKVFNVPGVCGDTQIEFGALMNAS